jgi:hypothetical protein
MREGNPAGGPIFRAGNGKPLNLDNLAKRVIIPALKCARFADRRKRVTKPMDTSFS